MKTFTRYIRYLFLFKANLTSAMILSLISAIATITPIYIIQKVVKSAFEDKNYDSLYYSVFFGLGAITLIFIFTYLSKFMMEYLSKRVIFKIRGELFSNLLYLPVKFYKEEKTGNIISIATNDIQELQFFTANSVLSLVKEPVVIILVLIKMFDLSFLLTGLILLISPIFVLIIHYLSRKVKTIETRIREKLSNLTSYLNQALFGIEIVKVFAMENNEIEKFTEENKKYLKEDKKNIQYINLTKPLVDFVGGLGVLFLLGFGGYLVINNKISSSQLTALIVALMTMSLPIKNFSETLIHIRKTSVSLERIFALIDEKREENANEGILISQRLKGGVSFKDVSFSYGDEPVLENIDITIEPGQVAAFVGYSGAGKTTLVNLIPRLFTPTLGKIFIDDYDITGLSLNSLRKQISVVTQQNIVFAGTVKENILYGNPDASMEDIIRASDISYCTEFIDRMPNGYDTYIGDRGVKLSGGQCQRLTLARAIVRNPAILILDEATSSLDSESEKLIQNALLKIIKNQTTFIISHRLSTVFNADIIFVMDKGRIVDKGTHSELLAQTGIYNKLYELQFNL